MREAIIKLFRLISLSVAATAAAAPLPQPGLRIVTLDRWAHAQVETIDYVRSDRRRTETRTDHPSVRIARCDRDQEIGLDPVNRTYNLAPLRFYPNLLVRLAASVRPNRHEPEGPPTLRIETTTVPTGETKPAFGYVARRVLVIRREVPLGGEGLGTETRTDGWYIDLEARPSCERADEGTHTLVVASVSHDGARPRIPVVTFKDVGPPERGFPIDLTTTWRGGSDSSDLTRVSRRVVTELSRAPLEDALFEVPHGFKPEQGRLATMASEWARNWQLLKSVLFD
jgi:hypothetical protein